MTALFDPANPKGREAPALYQLADRLSECLQFIELSESADAAEARTKITIGPIEEPLDSEEYTIEELENDFFICRIAPADEQGFETAKADTITECAFEGGQAEIYIRRQVRQTELGIANGRQDVYLFFMDRLSAIAEQVHEKIRTANQPRITAIRRELGPMFGDIATEIAQGAYIWGTLVADWGDLDLGQ